MTNISLFICSRLHIDFENSKNIHFQYNEILVLFISRSKSEIVFYFWRQIKSDLPLPYLSIFRSPAKPITATPTPNCSPPSSPVSPLAIAWEQCPQRLPALQIRSIQLSGVSTSHSQVDPVSRCGIMRQICPLA